MPRLSNAAQRQSRPSADTHLKASLQHTRKARKMRNEANIISMKPYTQLFASVVLTALDDAILDEQQSGRGADAIGQWARSKDGQMILRCAGIEPSNRCIEGLRAFVAQGIKTSVALTNCQRTSEIARLTRMAS